MHQAQGTRAIIIGAGIAGLTAAIALRRVGVDATVFEHRPELERIQAGGGIALWHNALRALRILELDEAVKKAGARVERVDFRTWQGNYLAGWSDADMEQRLGAPSIGISRADLHPVLTEALGRDRIRLSKHCTGFSQDDAGVTVRFDDGSEERADLLIGADGINSVVRTQFNDPPPKYAGYTLWHGIVSLEDSTASPGIFRLLFGCGSRFVYYQVGGGRWYWAGIAYVPANGRDASDGAKQALLERYKGWQQPVEAMIQATPDAEITRTDIYGGYPMPDWGGGRVSLMGDAAHPMTTNLGQGGCMAIEDGVMLMKSLSGDRDVVAALRAYERQRMRRTTDMMKLARRFNSSAGLENPVMCWVRNQAIKFMFPRVTLKTWEAALAYEN